MGLFGGLAFTDPERLETWRAPRGAGIYIVFAYERASRVLRLLYIGESGDLAGRGFPTDHHAYPRWVRRAGSASDLCIATHRLAPGTSEAERKAIEGRLIARYLPPCNQRGPALVFGRRSIAKSEPYSEPSLASLAGRQPRRSLFVFNRHPAPTPPAQPAPRLFVRARLPLRVRLGDLKS